GADYRRLFPEFPSFSGIPSCSAEGVAASLPGVIGSMQAMEAVKQVLGLEGLSNKLLIINALTWETRIYSLVPGQEEALQITPEELEKLQEEKKVQIIDMVKEKRSFLKLMEEGVFDKEVVVLVCQQGIQSLHAARMLRNRFHGMQVYSLVKSGPCQNAFP